MEGEIAILVANNPGDVELLGKILGGRGLIGCGLGFGVGLRRGKSDVEIGSVGGGGASDEVARFEKEGSG